MLSNVFVRVLSSIRPVRNYQQQFLRLLGTTESDPTENNPTERESGIVKRFSKDKGYGFISKNSDGSDCFVHFKNINATGFKTLEEGQEVEFTIVQGEKGPEARDVSITNTGSSRTQSFGRSSYNNSTSSRFGFGGPSRNQSSSSVFEFGGDTSSKLHSARQDTTATDKSFQFRTGVTNSNMDNLFSSGRRGFDQDGKREIGSVKRWSIDRGFGFIRRSNTGPDLFCHARSLRNGLQTLEEGQTVQYRIQKTEKGDEARDVTLVDEEAQQQETPSTTDPTERQTGTVRRWLSEKSYGFVRQNSGGPDVFVHLRNLDEGLTSLEEGQLVEFNIKNSDKGPMAENVIVRDEP